MKNDIQLLTKDCEREDCSISHEGSSTTLLGWTQTYDKNGNPKSQNPNTTTSHYRCFKCSKRWQVKTQYGKSEVTVV